MTRTGVDDLENMRPITLDGDSRAALFAAQTECTFVFATPHGWPAGVIVSYLVDGDSVWFTAAASRLHVRALADEPRVSLVVSNTGTDLPGRQMVTIRGRATVHRDRATRDWFFPRFIDRMQPDDPEAFARLLDSPDRVVVQVEVVRIPVSHDSTRLPGDGRGGR
ncbi:hypothetical protein GIY30_23275 [Gordonia sp. HNM0687]|uniref:Pyridoxamine 5'-phosphate oxidase N-terminal domain-containing protein n=1 Tax=Gordonia mangrovi TaxID=2665643 RepID=A0A6L7GW74_9ACTN|nr:pyridoxamine 5'-phosphate oxidase family protein [Gordonia mangrovi]MXP24249.1 hypothetical protein [Gordonia mangrovi]UVF79930.1 pyridoxamine 5'-phosphate oxidase family protein [Gordonia mangrovi]